jgi:hypothetical protein
MRVLLILAAIVIVMAVAGWITFSSDSGRSSINLETDQIREDTGQMMHNGSEMLRDAEHEVEHEPSSDDSAVPAQP